jgi:hypothetical protein
MMKALGALVGLALLASGAQAQTAKEKYELQERCGKRAASAFAERLQGVQPGVATEAGNVANYESHYNSRLNKCFYLETLVVLHKEGVHNSMTIFDINENKKYGAYISGTCYVQTKQCKTEEEWRALIKPFMED